MSFLSVLKKIGQEVNAASAFVPVYGQLLQATTALIPGDREDKAIAKGIAVTTDGLTRFQNIVVDAEVFGQAIGVKGADKAIGAAPAILQLFLDLPVIKGRKPKDAEVTKADAAALGGALAKFLNGFEG